MAEPLLAHDRYEAGPILGRGAQGVVFRVFDREARERPLVAKLWLETGFDESRAAGEFALLRRLSIPGLVRAHDFSHDQRSGAPFLVEDFVSGSAALDFINEVPAARAERLSFIVAEVAATLGALHDAAFVHGDLKPAHVRITSERRVFVLDLGAALSRSGDAAALPLHTPAFAAPEVRAGMPPTPASDLYSLGAVAWSLASGSAPGAEREPLRRSAAWVPPSLAELIEQLLMAHPSDRPRDAEQVLERLGVEGLCAARRAAPPPIGRTRELTLALEPRASVRYLVGPSGCGKSHLLREISTRSLLAGRIVRRVAFPSANAPLVAQLIAFFRGVELAWPFTARGSVAQPLVLALDDLHEAPAELGAALDAYRCHGACPWLDVLVSAREAPRGAECIALDALGEAAFAELCHTLGITQPSAIAEYATSTGRNPGWLVAARGRVPLTRDMVLERTRHLSVQARELLASLALVGGRAQASLVRTLSSSSETDVAAALSELFLASLVIRCNGPDEVSYALVRAELAPEIAAALASFEIVERVSRQALLHQALSAQALLTLGNAPLPSSERERLLERSALVARRTCATNTEIEALLALAANPAQRGHELLLRLERLTRHAGGNHPEVIAWLAVAAQSDPSLRPLAARRQAEAAARAGDFSAAEELLCAAEAAAQEIGERATTALCLASRGVVALYRADVSKAERALAEAQALLATVELADGEEVARIEHNSGVVALYADRVADAIAAFERSLEIKRRLGDRAGVRSCLLNLGLALARAGQSERACCVLDEAIALALSLAQPAGRAWCLAARADVEVRRGDARAAERFIAEAAAVSEAPPLVRADLALLRGQCALLEGDATRALNELAALDADLRSRDALLDTRARLIEAGAQLACLPARPRAAARLAIGALRAARAARLSEVERQAAALLVRARNRVTPAAAARYAESMEHPEALLWGWLREASRGAPREQAVLGLLRVVRELTSAERVLLAHCDASGRARAAWGIDLEGFALHAALERYDAELLEQAIRADSVLYLRDVPTVGGRGSRLALAVPLAADAARAVLLIEHRFRVGAFDAQASELLLRCASLAALSLRLDTPSEAAEVEAEPALSEASFSVPSAETTAFPRLAARRPFPSIVGDSPALRAALAKLDAAIDSELPVLILGETGTGKELFARALHDFGPRADAPFIALNCAAIPDSLFEAELFGHARGAFTGADRARPGLIARAEGGVLFLDEIAELPLLRQAALLRVLETRRYRAVGSDEERSFDVRIVSATNRPLEAEVERGAFRQDLLFRLNVIEVRVPSLRQRRSDIPALIEAFLSRSKTALEIAPDAMSALEKHSWPGNVRELEHQIQRLLSLGAERIERQHLPRSLRQAIAPGRRVDVPPRSAAELDPRAEVERALELAEGNITHAAQALGLTRHGLKKRMLRLGLRAPQKLGDRR